MYYLNVCTGIICYESYACQSQCRLLVAILGVHSTRMDLARSYSGESAFHMPLCEKITDNRKQ